MKCIILAAGYATRLYPLTKNFPKPLLKIGEKTILDWLVDDIAESGQVSEYVVISNHRYVDHFISWATSRKECITVVDDGTDSNEARLGAVRDIFFAVNKLGIDEDALVIAGDNVLDFSLKGFISYALGKNTPCIMRYYEADETRLKKSGVVSIGENDLITDMREKPEHPASNWCCPPFYYYTREAVRLVEEGIASGCGTDAPGSYIAWLAGKMPVYAMEMPGRRFDIGTLDGYEKIKAEYKGIIRRTKDE